jgi:LmbE family N-acetylglucosaminyl deacetylase
VIDRKRASMLAHASQIGADHFMLNMPDEAFEFVFGTEWFIVDPTPGTRSRPRSSAELFAPMP